MDEFLIGPVILKVGGPSNPDEATPGEIRNKQDELDHARRTLERKEKAREELNNEHSRAGDNDDIDEERRLGKQLEKADRNLDSIRE